VTPVFQIESNKEAAQSGGFFLLQFHSF